MNQNEGVCGVRIRVLCETQCYHWKWLISALRSHPNSFAKTKPNKNVLRSDAELFILFLPARLLAHSGRTSWWSCILLLLPLLFCDFTVFRVVISTFLLAAFWPRLKPRITRAGHKCIFLSCTLKRPKEGKEKTSCVARPSYRLKRNKTSAFLPSMVLRFRIASPRRFLSAPSSCSLVLPPKPLTSNSVKTLHLLFSRFLAHPD